MKRTALVVVAVAVAAAFLANVGEQTRTLHVRDHTPVEAVAFDTANADAAGGAQTLAWYAAEEHARAEAAAIEAARVEAARVDAARVEAERAEAARVAAVPKPVVVAPRAPTASSSSFAPCDGAYPPCWVVGKESGGNYGAFNATGCTYQGRSGCYGKWQFGWFWGGKLGLPLDLANATPAQQDEAARILWANGAGCSNWSAC